MDVYLELAEDIVDNCDLTLDQAKKVVQFLENEGLVDYDTLKETYLYPEEE